MLCGWVHRDVRVLGYEQRLEAGGLHGASQIRDGDRPIIEQGDCPKLHPASLTLHRVTGNATAARQSIEPLTVKSGYVRVAVCRPAPAAKTETDILETTSEEVFRVAVVRRSSVLRSCRRIFLENLLLRQQLQKSLQSEYFLTRCLCDATVRWQP